MPISNLYKKSTLSFHNGCYLLIRFCLPLLGAALPASRSVTRTVLRRVDLSCARQSGAFSTTTEGRVAGGLMDLTCPAPFSRTFFISGLRTRTYRRPVCMCRGDVSIGLVSVISTFLSKDPPLRRLKSRISSGGVAAGPAGQSVDDGKRPPPPPHPVSVPRGRKKSVRSILPSTSTTQGDAV